MKHTFSENSNLPFGVGEKDNLGYRVSGEHDLREVPVLLTAGE